MVIMFIYFIYSVIVDKEVRFVRKNEEGTSLLLMQCFLRV